MLQERISIGEDETAGTLHDRMKAIGANVLVKTIFGLRNNSLLEKPQQLHSGKHAPKIFTETCRIDWNKNVSQVYNLVRGLSPYPVAFTYLNEKLLKIYSGNKELTSTASKPGETETDHRSYLKFACTDGYLHCTEIQIEGKKKMRIENFLKGSGANPSRSLRYPFSAQRYITKDTKNCAKDARINNLHQLQTSNYLLQVRQQLHR